MRASELTDRFGFLVTLAVDDGGPKWMQVAEVGTFFNPRHGDVTITADLLAHMYANFNGGVWPKRPVELPVDYEHLATNPNRKPGDGVAAGWFKDLQLRADGTQLWALIEWNEPARKKIAAGEYRYFSPTIHPAWGTDGKHGPTLLGGAVTNYPTLPGCVATCSLIDDGLSVRKPAISSLKEHTMKIKGKNAAGEEIEIDVAESALTLDALSAIPAVRDLQEKAKAAIPDGHKVVAATELSALTTQIATLSTTVDSQRTQLETLSAENKAAKAQALTVELDALIRDGRMLPSERDEMQELAESNRALFDKMVTKRKAAKPIIRLDTHHGSGGQGGNEGSAVQQFDTMVEQARTANPKLGWAEAIKHVADANPDLAAKRNLELNVPTQDGVLLLHS